MKISGIGNVKKEEIMAIFTTEGRKAFKEGVITWDQAAWEYKIRQTQRLSKVGNNGNTFSANFARIPDDLKETLSPKQLAELTDAFYKAYGDGKNARETV